MSSDDLLKVFLIIVIIFVLFFVFALLVNY